MTTPCSSSRCARSISRIGCWDTGAPIPGQTFVWVHLNRVIRKYDLDMIYISGPGHGAPAVISNCYLEGTYSEIYPDKEPGRSRDAQAVPGVFLSRPTRKPLHA